MRLMKLLALTLVAVAAAACNPRSTDPVFLEEDTIRLSVAGKDQFVYSSNTCQLAFNRERKEFRMNTDSMSDYVTAKFNAVPEHDDQEVEATISWTTDSSVETKKNVTLKVMKLEGDTVWLWSRSAKIGLTLKLLY